MAAAQTAWDEHMAAMSAQQEVARAAAIAGGEGGKYFIPEGSTGWGSTSIAPEWLNPDNVASHLIGVGWRPGATGPHPDDMAAAAQRMTENFVYDPSVGGYTSQPGARARIAEAIREATG
jgi:hypothetical protein